MSKPLGLLFSLGSVFFLSACQTPKKNEEVSLTIIANYDNYHKLENFKASFEKEYPDYKIILKQEEDDTSSYLLRHNQIDADFIALASLITTNSAKDSLMDVTRTEYLNQYNLYVNSYLKASDRNIYCLPSPGSFYSYCANETLLKKYNVTFPNTLDNLLSFSSKIKSYTTPFVSSFPDGKECLDLLLQVGVGPFFSTVRGNAFFNNFIEGKENITSSSSKDDILDLLHNAYSLVQNGFFDFSRTQEESIQAFKEGNAAIISLDPTTDIENMLPEEDPFEYHFYPYFGTSQNEKWLITTPDFYLGTIKKENVSDAKKNAVKAFLTYFTSPEGQLTLMPSFERNTAWNDHFSYLKKMELNLGTEFSDLISAAQSGRVYLADKLLKAFSQSYSSVYDYLFDKIDLNQLVGNIDYDMITSINEINACYEVDELKNLQGSKRTKINRIARHAADSIREEAQADVLALPVDFVRQEIFDGTFYEDELELIFNSETEVRPYYLSGKELKDCLEKVNQTRNPGVVLSGVEGDAQKGFVLNNGQQIEEDGKYLILLPNELEPTVYFASSQNINCLKVYKEYLDQHYLARTRK